MTNRQIVETLARERRVEGVIKDFFHLSALTPDLEDLSQIIYTYLLSISTDSLRRAYEENRIGAYIGKAVSNQFNEPYSRFNSDTRRDLRDIDITTLNL